MKNNNTPEVRFAGFTGEWEERKLGELIKISSAARVHKNEWTTSGVRFFRSSDVVSNFYGRKNTPAFISYSLYNELSKKSGLVQPGDILVTGGGSIGIPYLVEDREPLYFKDADLIWLKSANKINGYFLYSYFVTHQLRNYISSITHIGTISHYTIEQAKGTPIKLPDQVEQTQIGNFLKQIDDTIALHQKELTTLKQTKQGFLQKMFPKEGESVPEVRFPGFTGEWEQRKFKDFISKAGKKNTMGENYPAYSVSNKLGLVRQTEQFDGSRLDALDKTSYKVVNPNEFAYNPARINVGSIAFNNLNKTVIVSSLYVILKMSEDLDNEFILQFIKSQFFIEEVRRNTEGSVREYLFFENFKNIKFPYTSNIEEQAKIGNFFKQLENTIALHQRELDALKETKKAFLQKMFV